MTAPLPEPDPSPISQRPDPVLLVYYLIGSLVTGPLYPIVATVMYFRYHTMRYKVTPEGLSMSWGILFRREVIIQFARIQDIHLQSNILERWLGLGRILIQTASGSAGAEMTLEGLKNFEEVRDFLYEEMRGVKEPSPTAAAGPSISGSPEVLSELTTALREATEALRAIHLERTKEARSAAKDPA